MIQSLPYPNTSAVASTWTNNYEGWKLEDFGKELETNETMKAVFTKLVDESIAGYKAGDLRVQDCKLSPPVQVAKNLDSMETKYALKGWQVWPKSSFEKAYPGVDPERDLDAEWETTHSPDGVVIEGFSYDGLVCVDWGVGAAVRPGRSCQPNGDAKSEYLTKHNPAKASLNTMDLIQDMQRL